MLIFDEKKYAKNLLKKKEFQTYRQKDIERYILIRYLSNEGMSTEEIRKELDKFPLIGCEYLDKKDVDLIYEKIINRALSYPLVTDIHTMIFKNEIEVINSVEDENARNLLFILLVYYKWATTQQQLFFFSKHNNAKMVITNDMDVWKYAGIMKLRVADRYRLCNQLIIKGLYVEDNFKSNNYFYLPFASDAYGSGEVAICINNYDNILGELYYYNDPEHYKRCSECGVVIKKTRSPKKYCDNCAKEVKNKQNIKYYKENSNLGKTQSLVSPVK